METVAAPGDAAREAPALLTERVLARLGPPRWLWVVLWSLVPLVSPVVYGSAIRASGRRFDDQAFADLFATQAVLAWVCLVLLAGGLVLGRQARELHPALDELVPGHGPDGFLRRLGSTRGPLVLTSAVVAVLVAGGWAQYDPLAPLASLPLLFSYMVPVLTFVWLYLVILLELALLGRRPLALDRFPHDRTLGLRPVGSLASTGLGLLLVAAVPILIAASDEPLTLAISVAIVGVSVGTFVLSMWRLHRQMAAAKARHVALAQRLYEEAWAPVRADPTIASLAERATALSAAQALDERAHGLLTWPIDEGAVRFLAVIVTSVLTSIIVRAVLASVGAT